MRLRKGDVVEVLSGDEKGRRGKILSIEKDRKTGKIRAVVEGLNLAKRHKRPRGAGQPGGIVDLPNAMDVSKLALLCPKCGKRSRVRREEHEGNRVRLCKTCGEIIDV